MTSDMKCRSTVWTTDLPKQDASSASWARSLPPTSLLCSSPFIFFFTRVTEVVAWPPPHPESQRKDEWGWRKKERLGPTNLHVQLPAPAASKWGEEFITEASNRSRGKADTQTHIVRSLGGSSICVSMWLGHSATYPKATSWDPGPGDTA